MTIPAGNNWCPTCHEACHDHPSVCTVCGTMLVTPPPASARPGRTTSSLSAASLLLGTTTRQAANATANGNGGNMMETVVDPVVQDVNAVLLEQTRAANREMRLIIESIRQQISATSAIQRELLQDLRNTRQEWQTIPPTLLDPSALSSSVYNHRPTSKEALNAIPRLTLHASSSMLYQSVVTLVVMSPPPQPNNNNNNNHNNNNIRLEFQATLAEFTTGGCCDNNNNHINLRDCRLVVAKPPRTGKGGVLHAETIQEIHQTNATATEESEPGGEEVESQQQQQQQNRPVILYMERGDGITFVQKMKLAVNAGAHGLIIGNHTSEPWPYFMKDSQNEVASLQCPKIIPTVMLKMSDAQKLVQQMTITNNASSSSSVTCHLEITKTMPECVVCTDTMSETQTIVRLPACGHVFHENCALQWLTLHNTCPYCRRELPTDDAAYEQERRRRETSSSSANSNSHSGNNSTTSGGGGNQYQDFYG